MNWTALFQEAQPIAPHALVALAMVILGVVQIALPKGTLLHRCLGWIWVFGMAGVAISGLFIWEIRLWGLFSPIHILSFVVLANLALAIHAARRGRIATHKRAMVSLFVFALIVPGAFTLLPNRVMYAVFFGG